MGARLILHLLELYNLITNWRSDTVSIHNILRSLSLVQSLLKDKQTPIWRSRNLGVNYVVKNLRMQQLGGGLDHWPLVQVADSVPLRRSGSGHENSHVDPSWPESKLYLNIYNIIYNISVLSLNSST